MSAQVNSIALGVGVTIAIVVTAASAIYNLIINSQQKKQQEKHTILEKNIKDLNKTVVDLQTEINRLRQLQNQQRKRRKNHRRLQVNGSSVSINDFDTDIDTFSTADTDYNDDEFYDCSDFEDDSDTVNGINEIQQTEFANIDKISEDESQQLNIYYQLKDLMNEEKINVEFVWRFARSCHNCAKQETDVEKKKKILNEGIEACEKIIDNIENVNLFKWYAILLGFQCEYLPLKEKIPMANKYKEYVEKALMLNPHDSLLHHLLGRFKYEVSKLSWFERQAASMLFAEPPNATFEDAIIHFKEAERISSEPNLENKLFLAKCHISLNQHQEAGNCLRDLSTFFTNSDIDQELMEEAKQLLTRYAG